ncbi:phage portal protein [Actinoplanes sp. URMC 104]|uniref:phage portal protein n=1 Tax=Actinoplanes sp. URMC 104 TaxID=3423409 RepID=UPI003F1A92B5
MIETEVAYSPGWYFKQLFNRLAEKERRDRLQLLDNHRRGKAPLPRGAENAREAFEAFCRMARSNFAELITAALAERMRPVGFRTASDSDVTGDPEIGSLYKRAGLAVIAGDVHHAMLALSESYVIVGEFDDEIDAAVVTNEDPKLMIGWPDPVRPRRLKAALKVKHDEADNVDRAYLYLDGSVYGKGKPAAVLVANRKASGSLGPIHGFNAKSWSWDEQRSGVLAHDRIPVVRFANKDELGEYEPHLDLIDRINHQLLQRMTVAVMQAFKQRAVKGLPQFYPSDFPDPALAGKLIDYAGVFASDPAAIWQLPETAEMWESGAVDLRPLVDAVSADVQHLASVTRTPLHLMMPAGDNQSAEGANLQREGLTFKARDRIDRTSDRWTQVLGLMLLQADPNTDRKALARMETIWASPELLSLAERADAAAKAKDDIPVRSRLTHLWQFPPDVVDQMMTERADEMLLAQQMAFASAAAAQASTAAAALPGTPQVPQIGAAGAIGPPVPDPLAPPTTTTGTGVAG